MDKKIITVLIIANILMSSLGLLALHATNNGLDFYLVNVMKEYLEHENSAEVNVEVDTGFLSNNIKFMSNNELIHSQEFSNNGTIVLLRILIINIAIILFWEIFGKKRNYNL